MSESDKLFTGSIAAVYDRYLVPMIFEAYARDLAERTAQKDPDAVLEIAAGSGVVTREVAKVIGLRTRYVVTDLNPPMLVEAARSQPDADRIEWQPADALDLPYPDESFDLVLCQFGVMFFPDRVRCYAEALRVLRPGGSLIFNMWDRIEENDFALVVTESLGGLYPNDPPTFLARTPHGHYDTEVFRSELLRAGFEEVTIDMLDEVSRADNPTVPAIAYCHGTPLRSEIEALGSPTLEEATDHATAALGERFGVGAIEGRIRAFVVTAR